MVCPELVVQYPNGNKYGVVVYTYKKGKVVRMTSKKGYIGISSEFASKRVRNILYYNGHKADSLQDMTFTK